MPGISAGSGRSAFAHHAAGFGTAQSGMRRRLGPQLLEPTTDYTPLRPLIVWGIARSTGNWPSRPREFNFPGCHRATNLAMAPLSNTTWNSPILEDVCGSFQQ